MSEEIQILVVTHKTVPMKTKEDIYVPMLVGPKKDQLRFSNSFRDDEGENIAQKNANYSELTALYWAWKNLDADYIGLVHYRRLFFSQQTKNSIVTKKELQSLFQDVDIILPKKRNYFIETTWSHYAHNHNIEDLKNTRAIIQEQFPEYVAAFDHTMQQKKSHRFNMLIMKKELFSQYCEWLFTILFELEKQTDIREYDAYQARIYGFISERLLDVWMTKNKFPYAELPFKFTEKQNWVKKGGKFIFNTFKNDRGQLWRES